MNTPSGTLHAEHFCFYCVGVYSREDTAQANFCLITAKPLQIQRRCRIHFCLTYFLATCLTVNPQVLIACNSSWSATRSYICDFLSKSHWVQTLIVWEWINRSHYYQELVHINGSQSSILYVSVCSTFIPLLIGELLLQSCALMNLIFDRQLKSSWQMIMISLWRREWNFKFPREVLTQQLQSSLKEFSLVVGVLKENQWERR